MAGEGLRHPGEDPVSSGNLEHDYLVTDSERVIINGYLSKVLDVEIYVNSSDEIKWKCLKTSVEFIRLIDKPTEEMWKFVVNKDPNYVIYVSKEFQKCDWYTFALNKISRSIERKQISLINDNYMNIFTIENPTEGAISRAVQCAVLQNSGREVLDEMVRRGLVEKDGDLYGELEEIILEAQQMESLL